MPVLQAIFDFIKKNPGALVTLIIIGAPIVSAILKAMAQKKQQRDAMIARDHAELESLRTGRPVPQASAPAQAEQVSAKQRLEELAARRRQAVSQVQTQGQPQARPPQLPNAPTAPTASPTGRTRQIRLPGGIILEVPDEMTADAPARPAAERSVQQQAPSQSMSQAPERARVPKRRSAAQQAQRQAQQQSQHNAQRVQAQEHADIEEASLKARRAALLAATATEAAANAPTKPETPTAAKARREAVRTSMTLKGLSREEWKRAIMLREVLGTPVGMR